MFYVLLNADGSVDRYPYTLTDLRRANPGTSFSKQIDDATAAAFNCFPVTPTTPPKDNYTINLERTAIKEGGNWVEKWISTPATPEQITERTENQASAVRSERNAKLADCDWTQGKDIPDSLSDVWASYRQELRDVTEQAGFPWEVVWPVEP